MNESKLELYKQNKLNILAGCKKTFFKNVDVTIEQKQACLEFASRIYDTEDKDAVHTAIAFGGEEERDQKEVFINTLQGKIAEYGFYNYFKHRVSMKEPDMELWGRGQWEDADFIITHNDTDYNISIKSTKYFGNLLLLESDRYNEQGKYLEPADGGEPKQHDWIFLIRVRGIEKEQPEDYNKKILENIEVEISGYIGKRMFKWAIQNQKILKKGITIGNMPLKVNNYWFCLTELKNPSPKS